MVRLKNAGLDELNLSTGDEHQEYVKLENISRAAIESVKLNITTVINVEAHLSSNFTADTLFKIPSFNEFFSKEENSDKLKIINGLWSDFKKGAKSLEFDKNSLKLIQESKKGCDSIFKIFSVFPDGQMAACCGLTIKKIKELKLGNLNCYSARFLYELQYMNFINLWLKIEGPYAIFKFLRSKQPRLNAISLNHNCQICSTIFNNPLARKTLQNNYVEMIPSVLFKYRIQKQLKII